MNEKNDFALVRRPPSALEKVEPGAKRIFSEIVADTLAVARETAAHDDLDALVLEGKRIQRRQGITPEDIRAFELFHRAAVAGHRAAQWLVGWCYADGHGVEKDWEKSNEWWDKLSATPENPVESFRWSFKAATLGFPDEQHFLGLFYYGGKVAERNHAEAVKWFRKAGEQGYARAQCDLGHCYYHGEGVEQDYGEAVKWYRTAAEQGDVRAQIGLGLCYENGEGVPRDVGEAIKRYGMAADKGNTEAAEMLKALTTKAIKRR